MPYDLATMPTGPGMPSGGMTTTSMTGDPDKIYAGITQKEFNDYIKDYRQFEDEMIAKSQTDTSLIDQAATDASQASANAKAQARRNAQRYGASYTPAQLQEAQRSLQRATALGSAGAINNARIAQREANTALLSDLINIGQGVNRSSLNQLGSAAQDAQSRRQAFEAAKASSKAQTYGTVGNLASTAILAFAF